jgi:hypothetical protein
MFHDLTKGQKRALRAAAQLAYERDTTMGEEDRRVHYLEARNPSLPFVVGGAVVEGIIRLDEVGEAARDFIDDLARRLQAVAHAQDETPATQPDERSAFDPNARVSLSAVLAKVDFVTDTATLFVNRRTGEINVYDSEVELGENPEESDDRDWVALLRARDFDDYRMMRKFAQGAMPAAGRDLEEALRGRGAYRRFREVVRARGLEDEWDAFRKSRIRETARSQLEQAGIAFRE